MITIPFKQFISDIRNYYDMKENECFRIENDTDLEITIWEIYDKEDFEMDYENNLLTLY